MSNPSDFSSYHSKYSIKISLRELNKNQLLKMLLLRREMIMCVKVNGKHPRISE